MTEYNVERHYTKKHCSQFDDILCQARVEKIEHFTKYIKNSNKKDSELATKLRFKFCESIAEKGRRIRQRFFFYINRICMSREEIFGGAN